MFFLKKMNFNFKLASKTSGFRFKKSSNIHNIEFCDDNISKNDLLKIASEHIAMVDFGFDDNELEKYSRAMIVSNRNNKSFFKGIRETYYNNFSELNREDNSKITSNNIINDQLTSTDYPTIDND